MTDPTMAMYEPLSLPPNADEQDFIQAYENVREKYKGMCVCVFAGATCSRASAAGAECLLIRTHAVCQSVS